MKLYSRKPMLYQASRMDLVMSVTLEHYINPRNGEHVFIVRWPDGSAGSDAYVAFHSYCSAVDFICTNFDG